MPVSFGRRLRANAATSTWIDQCLCRQWIGQSWLFLWLRFICLLEAMLSMENQSSWLDRYGAISLIALA